MSAASPLPRTATEVAGQFDLHGLTAVVTGGAGWLGRPVAKALAMADAAVILTDRDPAVASAAAAQLRAEVEGATVRAAQLDLGDLRSVRRLTAEYLDTGQPLSLLMLAEGALPSSHLRRTRDGFEELFGRYHLGHLALTLGLWPALASASGARVVATTSAGHALADVDLHDPNFLHKKYDPWSAYGQSHSAACLFTQGMTQHYAAEGIACNVADPGLAVQPSALDLPPDEAATTLVWAAAAPELDAISGKYLRDLSVTPPLPVDADPTVEPFRGYLPRAFDPGRALQLWDLSTRMINSAQ